MNAKYSTTLCLLIALMFTITSASQAGITVTASSSSSTLAGHTVWTFNAVSDGAGIDSVGGTFSGPMSQINPAGAPTVLEDNNAFLPFVGSDVTQDSQFKFNKSAEGLTVILDSESSTLLTAQIAGISPFTNRDIAQIVIPSSNVVFFSLDFVTTDGGQFNVTGNNHLPISGPVADAGGPYLTDPGIPITLDGSQSGDLQNALLTDWDWDTDGDFLFGAEDTNGIAGSLIPEPTGEIVNNFFAPHWMANNDYLLRLRVINEFNEVDINTTTVTITPEPAGLTLVTLGSVALFRRRGFSMRCM